MLPPVTDLLDIREDRDGRYPVGAAWIPASQIRLRLSELPPSTKTVVLVECAEAIDAQDFLRRGGRQVEVVGQIAWAEEEQLFRMWSPNEFLEDFVSDTSPGNAWDLGCGTGRDAVFLASLGWEVTAVDQLGEAPSRGRALADRYGVSDRITWICAQAQEVSIQKAALVANFFALTPSILQSLNRNLPAHSTLLIEAFTETHREKFGKPHPDRILSPTVIAESLTSLRVMSYEEGWRASGRHTARLVATS